MGDRSSGLADEAIDRAAMRLAAQYSVSLNQARHRVIEAIGQLWREYVATPADELEFFATAAVPREELVAIGLAPEDLDALAGGRQLDPVFASAVVAEMRADLDGLVDLWDRCSADSHDTIGSLLASGKASREDFLAIGLTPEELDAAAEVNDERL